MDMLVNLLALLNLTLATLWVVISMARRDRRYAAQVRADCERKSILRGETRD